ncbi:MAG: DUF262 domain-containing protein [Lewinellaceae bacterium]|nr:DUF262 domain-containing protein [Lewinellaceae bacterium]
MASLQGLSFFVDDYQRGYRWTVQQVLDILEDIRKFDLSQEAFYCLQPLVVKNRKPDREEYEVIDGQQRLTTIYLILKIIGEPLYTIQYETRRKSADFLEEIKRHLIGYVLTKKDVTDLSAKTLTPKINEKWKAFLKEGDRKDYDKIDNYHFFMAYLTIDRWFIEGKVEKEKFLKQLETYTHFIWYEDEQHDNSIEVFTNLNSGKTELTNAELIKALFVDARKDANPEVRQLRQIELAAEWDQIEQQLNDDAFWYFISNEKDKTKYPTRIDFLFEIIAGKPPKQNPDPLFTYRKYALKEIELDWKRVKTLFLKLREWFEDRRLYHLIGFIIDRKIRTIEKLVEERDKEQSKTNFKEALKNIIAEKFSSYSLPELQYPDKKCEDVLLLFNIETYQNSEAQFRFPFDQFKTQKWSLEHIHAQNAQKLHTAGELKNWVTDLEGILEFWGGNDPELRNSVEDKIKGLTELLKHVDDQAELTDEQSNLRDEVDSRTADFFEKHSINNLTLLDGPTNSALGNKPFKEKRREIIEIDKKGYVDKQKVFIPLCTRYAFLKYYSKDLQHLDYWNYQDRQDYLAHIQKTLQPYLPEKEDADGSRN